jgi:hypothetical protein
MDRQVKITVIIEENNEKKEYVITNYEELNNIMNRINKIMFITKLTEDDEYHMMISGNY